MSSRSRCRRAAGRWPGGSACGLRGARRKPPRSWSSSRRTGAAAMTGSCTSSCARRSRPRCGRRSWVRGRSRAPMPGGTSRRRRRRPRGVCRRSRGFRGSRGTLAPRISEGTDGPQTPAPPSMRPRFFCQGRGSSGSPGCGERAPSCPLFSGAPRPLTARSGKGRVDRNGQTAGRNQTVARRHSARKVARGAVPERE